MVLISVTRSTGESRVYVTFFALHFDSFLIIQSAVFSRGNFICLLLEMNFKLIEIVVLRGVTNVRMTLGACKGKKPLYFAVGLTRIATALLVSDLDLIAAYFFSVYAQYIMCLVASLNACVSPTVGSFQASLRAEAIHRLYYR